MTNWKNIVGWISISITKIKIKIQQILVSDVLESSIKKNILKVKSFMPTGADTGFKPGGCKIC